MFPIPPLIANGAAVVFADPIATPCSEFDVSNNCPVPFGVKVRFWFDVVPNTTPADPFPKFTVFADTPNVPAVVNVVSDDAVNVVVPDSVVVVFVSVVVAPKPILVVPVLSLIAFPFTCRLPPSVTNPVPVVIALLFTVFNESRL